MKNLASLIGTNDSSRSAVSRHPLRIFLWVVIVTIIAQRCIGQPTPSQDELPQNKDQGPLEFEPELQLYDVKPEAGGPTEAWAIPADVAKAKADADRAQRKAQRWQQLQKAGVLSKVEAEHAALQANRAVYRFQQARANETRKQVESIRARVTKGEASNDMLISAEVALKNTEALAAEAEMLLRRIDLEFAQNQLERQRRLTAAGIGSKSQLQKAQATLEQIKATGPSPTPANAPAPAPSR
jgi:multidrug resistance efflux pump